MHIIIENIEKVIIGKRNQIELILTAMLSSGHVLIEDVPGVGKTQLALALAKSCDGSFNRLQLTPDIMPGDITGFSMLKRDSGDFEFKEGAAFCNFLLADEVNRCSPKSQSALLEIMEERQVSMDGVVHPLPVPFMLIATQNPVETYGTYHLPEAQMDRFLLKFSMGYPTREQELRILEKGNEGKADSLSPVISMEEIMELKAEAEKVNCSEAISNYIMDIVEATRNNENVALGISPRGVLAIKSAAKSYAFIHARDYVIPDDIKFLAPYVFAHRLILSSQGASRYKSREDFVKELLNQVRVL